MRNKIIIFFCILLNLTLLMGCVVMDVTHEYEIGILYSTEYKNKSKLILLDEKFEDIYETDYKYGCLGHDGYMNAQRVDNILYECPQGTATEKEMGKIIGIDVNTGDVVEYDFHRTNITDFVCDNRYIYTTSNLNNIDYVDRYDRETGEIATVEMNFYISDLAVCKGVLYGFGADEASGDNICLYTFDFSNSVGTCIMDLTDKLDEKPPYMVPYKDFIFFANRDNLYQYCVNDNSIIQKKLLHDNGFNLQMSGDLLWIGCTDILSEGKSWIEVYNVETNQFVSSYSFDYSIQQIEIKDNYLYVGSSDGIEVYSLGVDNRIDKIKEYKYNMPEDYYLGGFYVK